jgi:hypothetical protein
MIRCNFSQRYLRGLRVAFLVGGSVVVLLTFAVWVGLSLRPFLAGRQQIQQELVRVSELRDRQSHIMEQLASAQEDAVHWESREEIRQRRCSTTSNDSNFLEWLNRQTELCGAVIKDFRSNSRQQRDGYQARGVSLTAQGDYVAICKLLDQLRNCPQMFRVISIDLTARDSEGVNMNLSLQGQLLTNGPTF